MNPVIIRKIYTNLPFCKREILRYAGCKVSDAQTDRLLGECISEINRKITGKICYTVLPVTISGNRCHFEYCKLNSENLSHTLENCERVIVFAATVGVEVDRLIQKYGRISPAKALMLQAIGAQQIEALCDAFCAQMEKELSQALKPRFSPGYGDLPLETQKDIFALLHPENRIGLTLNESLLMSPSKSVTAFSGISKDNTEQSGNPCERCKSKDCLYKMR